LHTIPHMLEISWFYFVIIVMWASWAQMTLNSSYSAADAQGIDPIVRFQLSSLGHAVLGMFVVTCFIARGSCFNLRSNTQWWFAAFDHR
jgi:hypothetical protein